MARAPNLQTEIDRLYAGPLAEFVSERNELAKRLRAAGDREAATSVKSLAKPSLTAWAVNRLHHAHPEAMAKLMAAGERIRAAHLSDPAALGDAVEAHRSALAQLVELARGTLESEGHPAGKAQVRRITGTLEALAALDPEALGVNPGRLVRDLESPGFGAFGAASPAPPPVKGRAKASAGKRPAGPPARGRKAATDAKARVAKAEVAKIEAKRKKSAALRRRIGAAETKRQRAADKAREAERALRAAQKALKAAERGAERKRRRARETEREAARAEKEADLARAALRKARDRDERARETLEARDTELASLRDWLASS